MFTYIDCSGDNAVNTPVNPTAGEVMVRGGHNLFNQDRPRILLPKLTTTTPSGDGESAAPSTAAEFIDGNDYYFAANTKVYLTRTGNTGYADNGWTGTDGQSVVTESDCSISVI